MMDACLYRSRHAFCCSLSVLAVPPASPGVSSPACRQILTSSSAAVYGLKGTCTWKEAVRSRQHCLLTDMSLLKSSGKYILRAGR